MREESIKMGKELQGKEVSLYNKGLVTTTHFYLTAGKQEIIPFQKDTVNVDYLIMLKPTIDISDKEIISNYKVPMSKYDLKIVKW